MSDSWELEKCKHYAKSLEQRIVASQRVAAMKKLELRRR